jgi:hypothetical protein
MVFKPIFIYVKIALTLQYTNLCTLQRKSHLCIPFLSPNFHIHVSVSDLYIPTMDLQEMCGPILGIYKSLTDT